MEFIKTPFPEHALDTVARLIGGRPVLADRLGVSVAAIGNWKTRGVPIEHCVNIELAVQGAITRRELRPDDWREIWPELDPDFTGTGPAPLVGN